ncbi:signal recognition particle, SRP9/SRP14 subunit [Flagelloscypha sp. PMI_526]|nr:signal recognition particle, SRP9/SRP14 subunit [Flagelloscypha sp. PMI_526]
MVYVQSWQDYQDAAEALYAKSPNTTRYCVKWNGVDGKLVLKITNNDQCIKFKTYSSVFLNRFESLNLSLIQKMQNQKPKPAAPEKKQTEGTSSAEPSKAAPPLPVTAGGAAAGGVKKKKGKKKK